MCNSFKAIAKKCGIFCYIMNTEQTSDNIVTYTKTHHSEGILALIRKLEKIVIKYSSCTNHNKILNTMVVEASLET